MEPISTASGPHETPSDRGKNLCVRRLTSSDLLFRYVEEVSDLRAARIRRCQKFELEASFLPQVSLRFSRSRVVLESLFVLAVGQMWPVLAIERTLTWKHFMADNAPSPGKAQADEHALQAVLDGLGLDSRWAPKKSFI